MKTFLLLLSIVSGIFLPYGHDYTFLIRYLLIVMLFFSLLDVSINKKIITTAHFLILVLTIIFSLLLFVFIKLINFEVALAVFIAAIGPTAIAAPVIISLKKGNVEFVVFSLLLNNVAVALAIPFLLPLLMGSSTSITVMKILIPVAITLSIPYTAAQLVKKMLPSIWNILIKWKDATFYLLMFNIYIATSNASHYIRNENPYHYKMIILIGIFTAIACALLFFVGRKIGGSSFKEEASFAMGQKNNAFTIWISLTYMNPIAVTGPVFYVLFQNVYISWELYRHNTRERELNK